MVQAYREALTSGPESAIRKRPEIAIGGYAYAKDHISELDHVRSGREARLHAMLKVQAVRRK